MMRITKWLILASAIIVTSCAPPQPRNQQPQTLKPPIPLEQAAPAELPVGTIPRNLPMLKIALLIPMSGESTEIGKAMMDAASMALYDNYFSAPADIINTQIVLLPKDSGITPADGIKSAKEAIAQGANFIVGPLFSQSVAAIKPIAKKKGIKMLTFSNNRQIAEPGIYTFGFLPEQQVVRMAEYTYLKGYTKVALLAPNNTYGLKVRDTLVPAYNQKGGVVAPVELYSSSKINIQAAVGRLAAANNSAQNEKPFEAIFIADSGNQLKEIIAALKRTNIDLTKLKFFGTGLWDDPEIARMRELQGAWFSSAKPADFKSFRLRFTTTYGYEPPRLASLAYDAVSVVVKNAISDIEGLNEESLTRDQGFHGLANGLVRLRPNGISDRKLAIMEIVPGGFKVIDHAPSEYQKDVEPVFPSIEALRHDKKKPAAKSTAPE